MSLPENTQALVTKHSNNNTTVEVQTIPFASTFKIKTLAPHEIVVKIKAIGLNPVDWKLAIGPLANTVGSGKHVGHDATGDVLRVGTNVNHLKVGDRVACFQLGCYHSDTGSFAEYSRFDSALAFKLPDNLTYEAGAALPIPNYTAMQGLYGRLKLPFPSDGTQENGYIFIWGASTACGHQAVQLARLAGLQVIATASSHNHAAILSLGATACEDYKDPNVVSKLKAAAGGNPITFAIDCVGTDGSSDRVVEAMSPGTGGHLISIMRASDSAEAKAKAKNIKVEMIYAGTLFGQEFSQYGLTIVAVPEDRVLISRWTEKELPVLLEKGVLQAPKLRVMPGGLLGVLQGFEVMKSGAYSAEKLVYSLT